LLKNIKKNRRPRCSKNRRPRKFSREIRRKLNFILKCNGLDKKKKRQPKKPKKKITPEVVEKLKFISSCEQKKKDAKKSKNTGIVYKNKKLVVVEKVRKVSNDETIDEIFKKRK